MTVAFQTNAFQNTAFQTNTVVSTANLRLPVNCVLMGEQVYRKVGRTLELMPGKAGKKVIASATATQHLSGAAPSFQTFRSGRGYD